MQEENVNNFTFRKRLQILKKKLNLSDAELGIKLGLSRQLLYLLRKGRHDITIKTIYCLERAEREAGIIIQKGKTISGLVEPVKLTRRTVGIYGIAYCKTKKPEFYDAKQSDHQVPQIEVPPGLSRVKRLAAFRACDSSMSPLINENDVIFFSPDYDLENGHVCVLKYDDTIVCKRFYKKDSVVSLSSDATGIAPILLKPSQIDWAYRALEVISVRKL